MDEMIQPALKTVASIGAQQRTRLPSPPGSPFVREEVVSEDGLWIGIVTTEPGGASPWHHHGEHTTYAYVLEGTAVVETAPAGGGEIERVHVAADGSFHVIPPGLVHREINDGETKNRFIIIRRGHGPPVVPVDPPA